MSRCHTRNRSTQSSNVARRVAGMIPLPPQISSPDERFVFEHQTRNFLFSAQRPRNRGGRFSKKAAIPSKQSSDEKHFIWFLPSRSSARSSASRSPANSV